MKIWKAGRQTIATLTEGVSRFTGEISQVQ
jgi:hypothetical protein